MSCQANVVVLVEQHSLTEVCHSFVVHVCWK